MTGANANFDPVERDHFDQLAASWWDPKGESRPLHELNPARLQFIAERCSLDGSIAVDVGCGGGILSESLAAEGASVTGIDISEKALDVARLHLHESALEVTYTCSTVEEFTDKNPGHADVVTCLEMLEHVPEPASVIAACAELVKPGGDLFFSTLNRTPEAFGLAIVGAEYLAGLIPRGTHRYDRFIRPSELAQWCRRASLEPLDICGLHYNPLSGTTRLGGNVRVNYLFHARRSVSSS